MHYGVAILWASSHHSCVLRKMTPHSPRSTRFFGAATAFTATATAATAADASVATAATGTFPAAYTAAATAFLSDAAAFLTPLGIRFRLFAASAAVSTLAVTCGGGSATASRSATASWCDRSQCQSVLVLIGRGGRGWWWCRGVRIVAV